MINQTILHYKILAKLGKGSRLFFKKNAFIRSHKQKVCHEPRNHTD